MAWFTRKRSALRTDADAARVIESYSAPAASESSVAEACIGLYQRAFEGAHVEAPAFARDALTPCFLGELAATAARYGNAYALIEMVDGMLHLTPVSHAHVQGNVDPASWRYTITTAAPTASHTRTVGRDSVVHATWRTAFRAPWEGVPPDKNARARLADVEHALARNSLYVPMGIVQRPPADNYSEDEAEGSDDAVLRAINREQSRGKTIVLNKPGEEAWDTSAPFNPPVPGPLVDTYRTLSRHVSSVYGVPPQILGTVETVDGTSQREAYRRFVTLSVLPFARRIEDELRRSISPDVRLDLTGLRAADTQGSARALKSLTDAGMSVDQAAAIVGLVDGGR